MCKKFNRARAVKVYFKLILSFRQIDGSGFKIDKGLYTAKSSLVDLILHKLWCAVNDCCLVSVVTLPSFGGFRLLQTKFFK